MPEADGSAVISISPSGLPQREPFMQHYFVGGNSIILNILKNNRDELNVTASEEHFEATLTNLMDLLTNETASITINEAKLDNNLLKVNLSINQTVGHKFPTGFPSRRAWIHLVVTDASGNDVFESGNPNSDGTIVGCDADENASSYEPHYDVIYRPDQVQIYESIMLDVDGEVTYTLLRAAEYAKDNRLLPPGFDIENAVDNIAIHGEARTDSNFIGGSDQIVYEIDTQGYSGPFTISVELLYQTISYQFIQDLYDANDLLIDNFIILYEETDKTPIQIASISQIIP
jgi:hypothetical protein